MRNVRSPCDCFSKSRGHVLDGLMIGRSELMSVKAEDIDNRRAIHRIENSSRWVFGSLYEIRQEQSEFRAINMSRKLSRKPILGASQSLDLEASGLTQTSPGIFL